MTKGIKHLGSLGGEEELMFNAHRVSFWEDEKFLEMDGGDGYTSV